CGSTELVDILVQMECGAPSEFFNENFIGPHLKEWEIDNFHDYVGALAKFKSADRLFGFKIDAFRLNRLRSLVDFDKYFPKASFRAVYMTRRNILEQAYSFAHAKRTGIWHAPSSAESIPAEAIEISDLELWREIALILDQEWYFETYFLERR